MLHQGHLNPSQQKRSLSQDLLKISSIISRIGLLKAEAISKGRELLTKVKTEDKEDLLLRGIRARVKTKGKTEAIRIEIKAITITDLLKTDQELQEQASQVSKEAIARIKVRSREVTARIRAKASQGKKVPKARDLTIIKVSVLRDLIRTGQGQMTNQGPRTAEPLIKAKIEDPIRLLPMAVRIRARISLTDSAGPSRAVFKGPAERRRALKQSLYPRQNRIRKILKKA